MTRSPRPGAAPAALAFIAVSVFLDALAQSISFPILPRLAQHLLGSDFSAAARWTGWLEVGWAIPQFLAAPLLGMLSDRIGRRPVIIASVFGVGVELILNALAPSVGWLLAGRMLCGFTCGAQAAAFAYVADVTPPEQRTGAYGWINGALWSGVVIGPGIGGLLAGIDLRAPFWVAAAVALAAGVYGLLVLPESLSQGPRPPLRWTQANPWGALRLAVTTPALALLAPALLLVWLAFQGKDNMVVLYTAYRYGWPPLAFGIFCTAFAAVGVAVQAGVAGRLALRICDRRTVLAGLGLQVLGMAGMGLAPTGALFWLANLPAGLGVVSQPALQSLMSRTVSPAEQGRLQGVVSAIASLASIAAPVAFAQLFAWTIARNQAWSGVTILVAAALSLAALTLVALTPERQNSQARR